MSAALNLLARQADRKTGRGTRRNDLAELLAVHAARQAASTTAQRVREGNPSILAGDEPARMAAIFAPDMTAKAPPPGCTGAFNTGVAARLAMGGDGESGVYSGT